MSTRALLILTAICLLGWQSGATAQIERERYDAILRDVQQRHLVQLAIPGERPVQAPPIVAAVDARLTQAAFLQAESCVDAAAIEPNQSGLYPTLSDSPPTVDCIVDSEIQSGFMFSSAYQRWKAPPSGDFSNVPDPTGCGDEWQTFGQCEDCCHDLGLNPWTFRRVRPNCPHCCLEKIHKHGGHRDDCSACGGSAGCGHARGGQCGRCVAGPCYKFHPTTNPWQSPAFPKW